MCVCACMFVSVCVSFCVGNFFEKVASLSHTQKNIHTLTLMACSVTRRKETQGEGADLTGIQLSVSNGGHPGKEGGGGGLGDSRPVVMEESGGQFPQRASGEEGNHMTFPVPAADSHLQSLKINISVNSI